MLRLHVVSLVLGFVLLAGLVSLVLSGLASRLARCIGAVDRPTGGRKIHTQTVPLWGGLGIAVAVLMFLGLAASGGIFAGLELRYQQLIGFVAGVMILLIGGLMDDARPQPPHRQIIFPILAALTVIAGGTGILQITHPFHSGALSLVWWYGFGLSLPADCITFIWLMLAMYATKLLDGLDGLVTGLTVIGSGLVAALALSPAYFQPAVAIFSGIIGGAYLGFLPRNLYPAKHFLGEAGSTLAGFSLGYLAILSSAKLAIALAVLAIPITDVAVVIWRRARRGSPWYAGDDTHLHFRLLQLGLSQRGAVLLLWSISLLAGVIALTVQTQGKIFLVSALILLAMLMSYVTGLKTHGPT